MENHSRIYLAEALIIVSRKGYYLGMVAGPRVLSELISRIEGVSSKGYFHSTFGTFEIVLVFERRIANKGDIQHFFEFLPNDLELPFGHLINSDQRTVLRCVTSLQSRTE